MGVISKSLIDNVYLPRFHEMGEPILPFFCNSSVARMCFISAYRKLPPFETLPKKQIIEMYRYVIEMFPEASNPERKQNAHIIYTVGTLL